MRNKKFNIAVVGATGVVGIEIIKILEERNFPVNGLFPLASHHSIGERVIFRNEDIPVEVLDEDSFRGVDIAFFSAGVAISKKFIPLAVKRGVLVIDNSSAWRMDPEVPLVVPEVNGEDIKWHKGVIANPNCSTIQMVVVLKPIHDSAHIKRVVVSTYQSVSGWGKEAVKQLIDEIKIAVSHELRNYQNIPLTQRVLHHQIAFNVIPHIDIFLANDYTKEEMKCVEETRKIMHEPHFSITATCVRVPVLRGHSEAVNIETEKKLTAKKVNQILNESRGIKVIDNPSLVLYPLPINAEGKDEVFVGRIREDQSRENGLNLWITSDNLRKGAALNAIQIAEELIFSF